MRELTFFNRDKKETDRHPMDNKNKDSSSLRQHASYFSTGYREITALTRDTRNIDLRITISRARDRS